MDVLVLILFTFKKDYSAAMSEGWICRCAKVEAGRTVSDSGGLDQRNKRTGKISSNLELVGGDGCGGRKKKRDARFGAKING